jgi:acetyltransferase-like isoleucine patch superfamily enzyme
MKLHLIYKVFRNALDQINHKIDRICCHFVFWGNDVQYKSFRSRGVPHVSVALGSRCSFGKNLSMNNGIKGNPIGVFDKCTFFVDRGANLTIGDNLGISQAAIICHVKIVIGNNVKIGGGVSIYDTDFHSLDPVARANPVTDIKSKRSMPIHIGNDVFIGAKSLILKGVSIGDNSIIGAGSIVTKSVPANQIWAGNPARFIKDVIN